MPSFSRTRVLPIPNVGVGVSGLQSTQGKGEGLDTALDQIADRYGEDTITRGLAMRRSEYSTLLKRDGVDGLLEALSEKIASLEAGEDEDSES